MTNDEEVLRQRLQQIAARPTDDVDVDAVIRHGLHSHRQRRRLLVVCGAAVAAAGVAIGTAVVTSSSPNAPHARATSRHLTTPTSPNELGIGPFGTCANRRYTLTLNGAALPAGDTPVTLNRDAALAIDVKPDSGQLPISQGTAQLFQDVPSNGKLAAANNTGVISGAANSAGELSLTLPLLGQAKAPLPLGAYNLAVSYVTPCPTKAYAGGEIDISVTLD